MGEACSAYEKMKNAYKILVGKPEGTKDLDGKIILKWI
jgi:hypothetical protein